MNYKGLSLVLMLFVFLGQAEAKIITPARARAILGPYPTSGSVEEERDLRILLDYQERRTPEECALAATQRKMTVDAFFSSNNGPLTRKEARKISLGILKAYIETGINSLVAKRAFKRPRPYLTWPEIKPCIEKETSYAYPSGHTLLARVFAHVLSRKYPDRAEAIMQRSDEIAESRILGGVHHPSDIEAGKKLADYVANKLFKNQKFLRQLESL